jgi:hypothetical protein
VGASPYVAVSASGASGSAGGSGCCRSAFWLEGNVVKEIGWEHIDWERWIPILANHAEKHQMHVVVCSSVFDRWRIQFKSTSDHESLPVDRYRRIWRSTRQLNNGWELLKAHYPSDFVDFVDERVVN